MSILHHPPISTLFPYTTLFRSPRKAILEILPGLAPELQLLLAARLAPARVEGIIKQLGGPDATVMGKPLVFRLTRLLPAADPLLLRALEQADLNCCDPATGRSLLHGFLAPGSIHRDMVNTLFQAGFDPACDLQNNLLLEAARLGDCYAVTALLRSGRVDANATDEDRKSVVRERGQIWGGGGSVKRK